MWGIFKKSLIKWSALAFLGVSAYFLGYFWGVKNPEIETDLRQTASETSNQPADLSKLKERVH
jgi:hypothetical protein